MSMVKLEPDKSYADRGKSMSHILDMTIEVAGCPTACMHCWAQGGHYKAMPFADIEWILEQGQNFCAENNLNFSAYPMHEVTAHPDAAKVLKLFSEKFSSCDQKVFEPLATTGVPLAIREDWRDLLEAAKAVGTTTLWLTFHGVGDVHDCVVNRKGAYKETCLAVERARSMGFRCACNVFVTKENVPQFDELVRVLQDIGINEMCWEVARYYPIARRRKSESSRPELDELLPLAAKIAQLSTFHKNLWTHLDAHTEAAYVRKALDNNEVNAQEWEFSSSPDTTWLVCRSNFNVYSGSAGNYGRLHGNLKADSPEQIFQKAIEYGAFVADSIFFSTDNFPSVRELAEKVGNPQGRKIYFYAPDMRKRWLDLALPAHRRY